MHLYFGMFYSNAAYDILFLMFDKRRDFFSLMLAACFVLKNYAAFQKKQYDVRDLTEDLPVGGEVGVVLANSFW